MSSGTSRTTDELLEERRVLFVEGEEGISRRVADELTRCRVDTAQSYEGAQAVFARSHYHVAILDVAGERAYDLVAELSETTPCVVLTERGSSPSGIPASIEGPPVVYLPKHRLECLRECVARALEPREPLWPWLFRRLGFALE